jgi:hypothetical protein
MECDRCVGEATRRLVLTDLDGTMLDAWELCSDCASAAVGYPKQED